MARNHSRLVEVAAEIESFKVELVPLALGLSQPIEVNITIAQAWRDHKPIDLLVNCAGVAHQTPFLQSQASPVQEEIAINLMGMYTITRLLARRMAVQRQGTIVNVLSLMGKIRCSNNGNLFSHKVCDSRVHASVAEQTIGSQHPSQPQPEGAKALFSNHLIV